MLPQGEISGSSENFSRNRSRSLNHGHAWRLCLAKIQHRGPGSVAERDQLSASTDRGHEVIRSSRLGRNGFGELHMLRVRYIKDGQERSLLLLHIQVGGTIVIVVEQ